MIFHRAGAKIRMNYHDVLAHQIAKAVVKIFQNDKCLLEESVHEITINHRLAIYLERYFKLTDPVTKRRILSVDLEYNRLSNSCDCITSDNHTKLLFEYKTIDGEILHDLKNVRPDIVVHERGTNNYNVLWLETKIGSDIELCTEDRAKVYYACSQLGFASGVSLLIDYLSNRIVIYLVSARHHCIEYEFEIKDDRTYILHWHEFANFSPEPTLFPVRICSDKDIYQKR